MPKKPNVGPDVVANRQHAGLYLEDFDRAKETGRCIFCDPNFQARLLNAARNDDSDREWFLCLSGKPSPDREGKLPAFWLLVVSKDHGDDTQPLDAGDWGAITSLVEWFKKERGITGGCYFVRDGNPEICGRVVRHPCVHYVVPRIGADGNPVPVALPVG